MLVTKKRFEELRKDLNDKFEDINDRIGYSGRGLFAMWTSSTIDEPSLTTRIIALEKYLGLEYSTDIKGLIPVEKKTSKKK